MVGIAVERAKAHCSDARSAASRGFLAIAWQGVRVNRKMPGNAISLCPNHGPATKPCSLTLDLAGGVSGFQFANGASFVLHGALGPPDGIPPGISSYLVGNLASAAPGTPPAAPRPTRRPRSLGPCRTAFWPQSPWALRLRWTGCRCDRSVSICAPMRHRALTLPW